MSEKPFRPDGGRTHVVIIGSGLVACSPRKNSTTPMLMSLSSTVPTTTFSNHFSTK